MSYSKRYQYNNEKWENKLDQSSNEIISYKGSNKMETGE